jgi:putative selenium metabolism protein SsnA
MLITNARVITWGTPNQILEDQGLLIREGKIDQLGTSQELVALYPGEEQLDARGQFVMPGNINCHGHFYSALVRGMAIPGDQPISLPTILERLWWPFDKALREEDVRFSALITLVDAVRHGTTTIFDHHSSPNFIEGSLDVIAEAVKQAGVRAVLCFETTDRDGDSRALAGIEENARFVKRCSRSQVANGRVKANFGMHACMTLSEQTLARCREAAPADAGFHIHLAEHEYDEYQSLAAGGTRSADRLQRHGLLNERTIGAHAIHLDAHEIEILAATGAVLSHQPRNNMNAGDGIADVESYLRAGINVCMGNDGLSYTMWKEWEFAYMAQKIKYRDARRLPADRLMQMAVFNSAVLASRYYPEAPLGVIRSGAFADLIFVDYCPPTPVKVENLPWHIVFGFNESMITTTIVDGKILMRDRALLTLDEQEISARCRELAPDLWSRYEALVPSAHVLG